jgi:hypothetical protein
VSANLLRSGWVDHDAAEILCILFQCVGQPGQYQDRARFPNLIYLPLADASCQVKLTYSDAKEIVAIEKGPAFDAAVWAEVVRQVENSGPLKFARDFSFSGFRVGESWSGKRSGIQILPPLPGSPLAPTEIGEHPFILEFPVQVSDRWPITNFRRWRAHHRFTALLNVLLRGGATSQRHRSRHLWALAPPGAAGGTNAMWVQESYFAQLGEIVRDGPESSTAGKLPEIDPQSYYATFGHDGQGLLVPTDLDDSICCYIGLSMANRAMFDRAAFWMDMASRQWTTSLSATFASLAIAIEALAERDGSGASARFRNFIERYAPGAVPEVRRRKMYAMRSDIVHGSGLMQMDQDSHSGWAPPEENERELMDELWGVARIAVRNWLKNGPGP